MSLFKPVSFSELISERELGKTSPEEMLALSVSRVGEIEEQVQAFEHFANDDIEITNNKPLSGISVGVKDIFDTYNMPTSYGSTIYERHRPKIDAAIVSMLRAKGASIIGKTTTTEFAFFKPTKTKNPNNLEYSPGGSSAGSAAAVASGMTSVAIGTQTGGSMIRPASFCGVAGFKPSYRMLPTVGMKYFAQTLDTVGVYGKSIADISHFLTLLTDRHLSVIDINPKDIRIGIYSSIISQEASEEMKQALQHAAQIVEQTGFTVVNITEPDELRKAYNAHEIIQNFEAAQSCASDYVLFKDQLSDKLARTIETGANISPQEYDAARRASKIARRKTQDIFAQVDILLTPSAPSSAPIGFKTTGIATFNKLWTLLGTPSVNIAGLRAKNGMPLGIQAIGKFGSDQKLLSIAHIIETAIRNDKLFTL
jgi:Asp-tRNA(Asn)/Glu-tRNA(Gln) amidotransferase A subunit family amidase